MRAAENKFEAEATKSRVKVKFEGLVLRFDPRIDRKSMDLVFKVSLIKELHACIMLMYRCSTNRTDLFKFLRRFSLKDYSTKKREWTENTLILG